MTQSRARSTAPLRVPVVHEFAYPRVVPIVTAADRQRQLNNPAAEAAEKEMPCCPRPPR